VPRKLPVLALLLPLFRQKRRRQGSLREAIQRLH
jgi:hypothetical protein